MSALTARATTLLRGLAEVSQRVLSYESKPSPEPEERATYVRLCRCRRALKHDCYQLAEEMTKPDEGLFLMHVQEALIGELHGKYALKPHEVGSYLDPANWQVENWSAPRPEGF
jgi:hypothetical protein